MVQVPEATSPKEARTVVASQVPVAQSAAVAQAWQANHRELAHCLQRRQDCCQRRRRGWAAASPGMVGLSCLHTRSGACPRRTPPEKACYLRRHLLAARFASVAVAGWVANEGAKQRGIVLPVSCSLQAKAQNDWVPSVGYVGMGKLNVRRVKSNYHPFPKPFYAKTCLVIVVD